MKILILPLYPEVHPSSRNRVYAYLPYLDEAGIEYRVIPAVDLDTYQRCYNSRSRLKRWHYHWSEYKSRHQASSVAPDYDFIWVQKGYSLISWRNIPGWFQQSGKPIVYDIDDAVFLSPPARAPFYLRWLEDPHQVQHLLSHSELVLAGNRLLAEYTRSLGGDARILPTPVDTRRFHPTYEDQDSRVTIGWIGSPATHRCLNSISGIWHRLAQRHKNIEILIVSGTTKGIDFQGFGDIPVRFEQWSAENEAQLVRLMDIGLMPLEDTGFQRYKCSFKALQYMASGIPVLCSPVGTATDVVLQGESGFWCDSPQEWIESLETLIESTALRRQMGERGRARAEADYSLDACAQKLLPAFER
jgi:glycosyltransferase involved in cell wall biosynthesis